MKFVNVDIVKDIIKHMNYMFMVDNVRSVIVKYIHGKNLLVTNKSLGQGGIKMILETEDEKNAFEFVCELADKATDRICNDLEKKDQDKFKHLEVETTEMPENKVIMRPITMDFDILHWLKGQVKIKDKLSRPKGGVGLKLTKESIKSAIYNLTNSANQLQGINGYEDIQKDIIIIRDKLKNISEE